MTEPCQSRLPVRPWRGKWLGVDFDEVPDRSYWHPCTKGHVAQCRGIVGWRRALLDNSWGDRWGWGRSFGPMSEYLRLLKAQMHPNACLQTP